MSTQQDLISANAALTALLSYDSVWTGYAKNPDLAAQSPFTTLEIAHSFRGVIAKAVRHANTIAATAQAGDYGGLGESLREVLSSDALGQSVLDAVDEHEGSVAQLASKGLNDMQESKDAEEEQLEEDLSRLFVGQAAAGNFGDKFLCGLAKASMAAGLITVWVPPHVHAGAAVALGATAYKAGGCAAPAQKRGHVYKM